MRMSPTIDQLIDKYGLPTGYERTTWDAVRNDQQVWVYGTQRDDQGTLRGHAYGPHTVDNQVLRRLRNSKGVRFLEYQQSLLVLTPPPHQHGDEPTTHQEGQS